MPGPVARLARVVLKTLAAVVGFNLILLVIARNPAMTLGGSHMHSSPPADPARLRTHVEALSGIQPPRNFANTEALERAAAYIAHTWRDQGLDVSEQSFTVAGETYKNLIVSLGPENSQDRIVIGAHYDVCDDQPGADDNASGVAGLLELTRLLAPVARDLPTRIDFVAYTLEEPPYFRTEHMGSVKHAQALKAAGVKVRLMLSLEMIGYFSDEPDSQQFPLPLLNLVYPTRGNFIAVVGDLSSFGVVRSVKRLMARNSGIDVYSINAPRALPGVDFSDHQSYWNEGYPAAMITDTAFLRNQEYHQPGDTPNRLDYKRMAEVVNGVFGVVRGY